MIRRLQSMFIWNAHHQVHSAQVQNYYGPPSARITMRKDARRSFENDLYRISTRM